MHALSSRELTVQPKIVAVSFERLLMLLMESFACRSGRAS